MTRSNANTKDQALPTWAHPGSSSWAACAPSQSLAKETHVKSTRLRSWLLTGLFASAIACSSSPGRSPGQTGGTLGGGVPASGGRVSSGGVTGVGGAIGGQNSGGASGGSAGRGGATGTEGGTTGLGGQGAGGAAGSSATGGRAAGGAAGSAGASGSAGAQSGGSSGSAGGTATGGVPATGGQGSGGKNAGGSVGNGGNPTGGSSGSGGSVAGGASGTGGTAGGASGTGGSSSAYHPCPSDGTACKIMPFGDSITDGYNADTPGGYRVELFKRAHADSKNIPFVGSGSNGPSTVDGVAFPPRHEGHSGWTIYPETSGRYRDGISYCLSANSNGKCLASNSVMSEYKPDIVLLMIGTNDCIDSYDLANAPTRLGTLIDTIYTQLPNVLIVVAQPIPSRGNAGKGDDAALPDRLKTYGDAIPAVVQKRADAGKHILLVDMYTPFNPNKASLIEDEWHPNLQGYVLLGDQWYSVLKPLL